MDVSQLPSVSGLLVTADNPARTDLLGMDHARCAALHNYLVHYAWIAEGHPPASLHGNSNNTFFTAYGAAAEALRPRLDPSLAAFLDTAMLPPIDGPDPAPFFFWASGLTEPDVLFANQEADLFDEPVDSLVFLYLPNTGQGAESGVGLFYHQGCHHAAVFKHMDDYDFAMPVAAHPELWHPLETVLSTWIDLIHLGKIVASPRDAPPLFGVEKIGPWEWRPYSEAQVASCVGAWDRLCAAIEARVSLLSPTGTTSTTSAAKPEPLLTPPTLDAASIPKPCFARSFLSRTRRPAFRYIAPGLLLPPPDATEFTALKPYASLPRSNSHAIPPVCLFATARGERREADVAGPSSPFCRPFWARSNDEASSLLLPSRVPAGVYSEAVERDCFDNAEEAFRLLLPFGLEGDVHARGEDVNRIVKGARKSDGSFVRRGTAAELFQHGYKPFGGDYYRAQRLERLLEH
ncbi:S-adenosylmethionine synthase protein [Parachaetomium inaequale]|uniref:S-adenosylmethionine synthase protein n=1 Tax=Parachaetomium inaequale TaxID=2588326 RepID=A0AAN6P7C7_9PEZI|nr:S-adenosylmethionine synthase protein [Parachaetomium inaequale]